MGGGVALILLFLQAGGSHAEAVRLFQERKYELAAKAFDAALDGEKAGSAEYAESALLSGQARFFLGEFAAASALLRKSGNASPEVVYMLGVSALQTGDDGAAVAEFGRLYGLAAGSADALLVSAQMAHRLERADQAGRLASEALKKKAGIPGAHQILGEIAAGRNEVEGAVAHFRQELAVSPASAAGWYRLGEAHVRGEDWAAAVPALQRSIWLSPFSSGPYISLGKAYFKLDQIANAEGMLRRAVAIDKENSSALYLLGQVLVKAGKAEEGKELMKRSLALKR